MNLQSFSGIVLTSGFVLWVLAMASAPKLYQTEDITSRIAIIAANQARWNLSQLFFALGGGVPAGGFLLLAISQRAAPAAWLYFLGAAAFAAGSVIEMWLVYRQTQDPAAFWEGAQIPNIIGYGFLALTLVGILGLGLAMLQGGFPNWVGYLMAGSAAIFLIAIPILGAERGFWLAVLAYLVASVAGIVIWRQG